MNPNTTQQTIVNSWNEWDPLKHVILGRPDGGMVQAPEPALQRNWPQYGFPYPSYGRLPKDMEDIAKEQMDNLQGILEKRGIRVSRPIPIDFSQEVSTPDWTQESMFSCMPPRDLLLTIGNEILEATMAYRSRWYEYLSFRPIMEQLFKDDPNFRWEAAPKPRLTDESFVSKTFWLEFEKLSEEKQIEYTYNKQWVCNEKEPLFEAADVARFGKDLFVQRSAVTNGAGIDWLRRHFPDHRIHEVTFYEKAPIHIDTTIVPLRPGLVLMNAVRTPMQPELIELFKKNDWEIITCAKPYHEKKVKLAFCSIWISMNMLVLDPKTVCVADLEKAQQEQLSKHGFDVIPVPYWDVAPFGGGLHCSTADVYREGSQQDYFPKQIPGF